MPRVFSSKNLVSLANRVRTSEAAVSFLQQNGILHSKTRCSKCFNELTDMRRRPGTSYWYFHCQPCQTSVSIRNKTILSHSKIGLRTFVLLAYTFIMCQGLTIAQKIHEVFLFAIVVKNIVHLFKADLDDGDYDHVEVPASGDPHLSSTTCVEYQKIFRDIISSAMMDKCSQDYMVGGPGTTIEIDESQYGGMDLFCFKYSLILASNILGKRKYHRGSIGNRRRMWVLGGVVRLI